MRLDEQRFTQRVFESISARQRENKDVQQAGGINEAYSEVLGRVALTVVNLTVC